MNLFALVPTRYAKAVASLVALALGYIQAYGFTWHPLAALPILAYSAGIYQIPNSQTAQLAKPVQPQPPAWPAPVAGGLPPRT